MQNTIERSTIFNNICALIILSPVFFSFVFAMLGLPVPSYLFIIILVFLTVMFIMSDVLTIVKNRLKTSIVILFSWILLSIFYTNSVIASQEKFISIIYNTIIPFLLIELFFLFSKKKKIEMLQLEKTFLKYTYFLIWFAFVAFALFRVADETGRYMIPGLNNPIWFSRFVGMLMVILLYCDKPTNKNFILYISSMLANLILVFASGSRGPLLAVIITYCFIKSYSTSMKKILLIIGGIVVLILIGFNFVGGYLFETNFYSLTERVNLISLFSGFEFDYLKGNGIGSYSISFFGKDVVQYPHNVFFELFIENGIIGVILFSITMWLFFKNFKPNVVNFLCFFYFLTSLPSGDIPGNNNLFLLLFISTYAADSTITNHTKYYRGQKYLASV